jgi:uncharacterized protein (TIGR02646 family)
MIKLVRWELTEELAARTTERAARLRQYLEDGEDPPPALLNSYRDPELKQHLVAEAHGKCVYCESKITHVYFGDIEHMRPKSAFPAERLDVNNLALACALCNNAKGEFWDETTPWLDPYTDDPRHELLALGYIVARRPGRDRARLTVDKLQLNRPALVERRKERVELLQSLADQYVQAPTGPVKDLLRAELCRHASDSGEYAFIVRSYLEAACSLQCDHPA